MEIRAGNNCSREADNNGIAKRISVSAMLIALALLFSYLERMIPLFVVVPVPGIKLGLANIITVAALFYLDVKTAVIVTVLRCVLANFLFGTMVSMIFALSGALLALAVMAILKTWHDKYFTVVGISAAGAAAHNIGQMAAASLVLRSTAVMAYLPVLLVASVFTGFITGVTALGLNWSGRNSWFLHK